MISDRSLKIRPVGQEDATALSALLGRQAKAYRSNFHPFADESERGIRTLLESVQDDCYRAVLFEGKWVAFFMLRGCDSGYERPAFGLLVDERQAGKGVGMLCLRAAMTECRLRGVSSCMLKVAPENGRARAIYEKAGFRFESVCATTGHEILSIEWKIQPD